MPFRILGAHSPESADSPYEATPHQQASSPTSVAYVTPNSEPASKTTPSEQLQFLRITLLDTSSLSLPESPESSGQYTRRRASPSDSQVPLEPEFLQKARQGLLKGQGDLPGGIASHQSRTGNSGAGGRSSAAPGGSGGGPSDNASPAVTTTTDAAAADVVAESVAAETTVDVAEEAAATTATAAVETTSSVDSNTTGLTSIVSTTTSSEDVLDASTDTSLTAGTETEGEIGQTSGSPAADREPSSTTDEDNSHASSRSSVTRPPDDLAPVVEQNELPEQWDPPILETLHWVGTDTDNCLYVSGSADTRIPEGAVFRVDFFAMPTEQPSVDELTHLGSTRATRFSERPAAFRAVFAADLPEDSYVVASVHSAQALGSLPSLARVPAEGPDADVDGVNSTIEGLAPSSGDGNQDGIADDQQAGVASIPSLEDAQFITIDAGEHPLAQVTLSELPDEAVAPTSMTLPYGMFSFDVLEVVPGGVAEVQLILPEGSHADAYFKQDPISGALSCFDYDGTTGAVIHDNVITLHLLDGGRGDADGVANGVIVDPGGPGLESTVHLSHELAAWTVVEQGGTASPGELALVGDELVLSEGDSFRVSMEQQILIPANPSLLAFEYIAELDTDDPDGINDALEVALLDEDGYPLVATIGRDRDSFLNETETEPRALGASVISGGNSIVLDISNVLAGSTATLVVRLINNDTDTTSRVRLLEGPLPTPADDVYGTDEDVELTVSAAEGVLGDDRRQHSARGGSGNLRR